MTIVVTGLLFTATLLNSCKKDEDDSPSRSELIVGTWNVNAYGTDANMNGTLEATEYGTIPAGAAMVQTYRRDGTGVIITQPTTGSPVSTNITWSLTNNDQNLRVATDSTTTNATISKLTEHELMGYDPAPSTRVIYLLTK